MELGILIAFMAVTFAVMIGMMWVFKDWLKQRSKYLDNDNNE